MEIKIVNLEDRYRLYVNGLMIEEENNLSLLLESLFDNFFEHITLTIETLDDNESWPNE